MEGKTNILLIEDNRGDSRLIEIYLKEAYGSSAKMTIGETLQDGIKLLKKGLFDIIVIDLSLPDSSGLDTFVAVFKAANAKPVIVLTGMEDELIGMNTVKLGAQDFLIKNKLNSAALRRSIDYSIERYKLLKELSENSKKLEEKTTALFREKQKLAQAQKLTRLGSWEWDIIEEIFTGSDQLFRILGISGKKNEELTFPEFIDFIHPDDRGRVSEIIDATGKGRRVFDFFHRIVRWDGAVREIHTRGELEFDDNDDFVRIVGTAQDITARKKEQELEKLAMVAIKSFNAVTIANKEGKIEWVNDGFTKLSGYKLEDVEGTYGEILRRGKDTGFSPDTDYFKSILKEKRPLSYENRNFAKDGTQYWVLTSLTPILDENGDVEKIISIDSDITKQKRAEQEMILANDIAEMSIENGNLALEELHRAKAELEESLKVKERFMANMSHEIRTPMNAIIGFTNLMLKSDLNDENKQYLSAIQTSGENLLVIINDILDISKMASGKITFEKIPFDLTQLVTNIIELMKPKAEEKNLEISMQIDNQILGSILGDPTRLNQILTNLVGNAIKFTESGNIKIIVSIVDKWAENIDLKFEVIDTGIGIPAESLERIFESFSQATSATSRKFGGTGLGLAITKQLIELQGGKITVHSEINVGTSFEFILNYRTSRIVAINNSQGRQTKTNKFPLKGIRVLVVEDNAFNQLLAIRILEGWKCIVDVATDGKIATKKVEKKKFDIILMDLQLPEMDGYETTHFIRNKTIESKRNTPIIAMTAHAFASEAEKCLKATMNDYISKPFNENTLYTKMLEILKEDVA